MITITLIGVLFGFLLGQCRFSGRFVFIYSLILSIILIPWQLGLTLNDKIPWLERLSSLGGRLWITLDQFTHGVPVEDSVLFLTAMLFVFWLASLTASYHLVRNGRPWFGLALIGISVLIIEFYDPPRAVHGLYSSLFAILVVLLVSRLYFLNLRRRWESSGIPMDAETSFDWMRAALISGVILVFLAWNIPSWIRALSPNTPERREFVQSWLVVREKLSNVVAPLSGTAPTEGEYYQNDLIMGTTFTPSDEVVFTVTSSEPRPAGSRYYWRARAYDRYQNGEWFSTYSDREEVTPVDEVLPIPDWKERFDSTFAITLQTPIIRNLFTPGLPLSVSRPAQALGNLIAPTFLDTSTLLAVPPLRAGEIYRVKSSISLPIKNDIETSQGDYPEAIQRVYLQLPSNFPEDIRNLAEEITAGLDTPFDKTEAITNYLRQNITYKPAIQAAPYYLDPIEFMLFTTKEGFCFYYASAEILMLRSIGIPARLAVGFAEGEMNDRRNSFTVRRKDAHAWPEVYFNDFGWVEFEPTVIQSALVRRELSTGPNASGGVNSGPLQSIDEGKERSSTGITPEDFLQDQASPQTNLPANRSIIIWLALLLLLFPIGLGLLLWLRLRSGKPTIPPLAVVVEANLIRYGFSAPGWIHERARLAHLTPLEQAFNAVPKALRLLGKPANPSLTPAEQVSRLVETLPKGQIPALTLLEELHRGMYSPLPANMELAQKSSRQIMRLARRTWLQKIIRLEKFRGHPSGF
ncbi:transglutaminase family protein [Longilinea arvoryzae]|uniref:transglutaminase family protein n=1 Tax=Longilinea arvoryzae TaxID=360412 RepID=UPI00094644B4|nr:transglutaminase domain-containing protein [Longilinea arvoryzae]